MRAGARVIAGLVAMSLLVSADAFAQEVHEIRMVAQGKREFRFQPASINARRGDVLLFKAVDGAPHSVVFDGKGVSPADQQKLNSAMPRRAGDLSSPLLTEGSEYRVVIPVLTAGTYRFYCLPHKAYDMRGEVTVR
jgi:plastocyanin